MEASKTPEVNEASALEKEALEVIERVASGLEGAEREAAVVEEMERLNDGTNYPLVDEIARQLSIKLANEKYQAEMERLAA